MINCTEKYTKTHGPLIKLESRVTNYKHTITTFDKFIAKEKVNEVLGDVNCD